MQIKQFFLIFSVLIFGLGTSSLSAQVEQRTVSEYEARQQAIVLAKQAEKNLQERDRALREALAKRDFYHSDLNKKKRDKAISKQELKLVKLELSKAEQEITLTKKKVKSADFWAKETQKMIPMTKKKRDKVLLRYGIQPEVVENMVTAETQNENRKLTKIEAAERELAAIKTRERFEKRHPPIKQKKTGTVTSPKIVTIEKNKTEEEENITPNLLTDLPNPHSASKNADYAQYDPAQNTFLNPPNYQCKIEFSGKDQFSGKIRID